MGPITKWHEVVSTKNYQLLEEILDDNVIFYSPVVFTPQKGKEVTKIYLSAAAEVFEGNSFSYVRELIKDNEAALEFELELDEIKVNGVDLITWNHEKKITEFKVFIRPLQAVNALHQKMGAMLESAKIR
ncbi:MAG: nuclear transport factor 2 family protein [Pseudomonadota bacterium]|nr:nuclear transport factor 2 family protein [Pseudomonadota bacterium]